MSLGYDLIFHLPWIPYFFNYYLGTLPEEVLAHYNALGEVDRWGSKWELLILPGVGAFII